ncbi:hypothetical protein M758_UG004300 [Ceratodon purpureus]|nr:hypothetical protein M758_UG004300 [Ceratodon purpureus]
MVCFQLYRSASFTLPTTIQDVRDFEQPRRALCFPSKGICRPFSSSLDHSVPPSSHCHQPSLQQCQTRYLAHYLTLPNPRELNGLDANATGPNAVAHYHRLQHFLNPQTKEYNSALSITATILDAHKRGGLR